MKEKQHTFIICAYGESVYLKDCIESCLHQTSVEMGTSVVCLYTSTPNQTIQTLCSFYKIPLYTSSGGGIGKDWNNALSFVQTKYATIAHQDDIYLPDYGTVVLNKFQADQTCNIVFTDYEEINAEGAKRPRNKNLRIKTFGLRLMTFLPFKWYQRRVYAFGNFISCPAVSYNLERLHGFKFNEKLKMTLDWDAWERIMKLPGSVKYVSKKLMYHRIHSESETTANTRDKTREAEEYEMYRRYWGKYLAKCLMKFYVHNQQSNQEED
jgi:glycosyltransferase involved in cell wall biosynthesis